MSMEDFSWLVRWARVLDKIKSGASEEKPVELNHQECADLARGIRALMKESWDGQGEVRGQGEQGPSLPSV